MSCPSKKLTLKEVYRSCPVGERVVIKATGFECVPMVWRSPDSGELSPEPPFLIANIGNNVYVELSITGVLIDLFPANAENFERAP